MENLAERISSDLLPRIRRPSEYIGLEINRRCGDVSAADVTVAMAFPDAYGIGISHLGSQVLYHMLNDIDGVACDRTYCPHPDVEQVMRERNVPLFGWESRCAVGDFDVMAFSLAYEMCATNALTMLDLAGVAIRSADRDENAPLIIAGDAMADSPEPVADFFDLIIAGDGEQPLTQLVEIIREMKRTGRPREEIILAAAKQIPSAYAPRFYQPKYSGGAFAGLSRLRDDVPEQIHHASLKKLSDSPAIACPLVPLSEAVHERVVIEIMRGCPNACRFCQAGSTRLPVRIRPIDEIVAAARKAIDATGYREISLLSLSTSDYPKLDKLIDTLNAEFADRHVSISLPSLRVGSQLKQLPKLTSTVRKSGLTIAAEAATDRLRKAIHKPITDEDMLAGVHAAYEAGWRRVKVYFMAGLPGETEADIDAIFHLCKKLSMTGREAMGQPGSISASVSWFVPKPHTPMQWAAMRDEEYYWSVRNRLRDMSQRSAVNFKFHHIERSLLEGMICRGDRRVGDVIEAAWRNGARMDAWNEHFDYNKWTAAFEQTGLNPTMFTSQELPLDAPLPWSHITCYRDEEYLAKQYAEMKAALNASV